MPARLFYDAVQYKTTAESEPVRLAGAAAPAPSPATNIRQEGSPPNPATARAETTATLPLEAIAPVEPAPVDGLKISSQFWRRADWDREPWSHSRCEISCAFVRRDGSHLTDRTRTIHDTLSMKSRKTFARLHVGFVNVNADRAKCSPVTASRV
jgi:hypothetical protein